MLNVCVFLCVLKIEHSPVYPYMRSLFARAGVQYQMWHARSCVRERMRFATHRWPLANCQEVAPGRKSPNQEPSEPANPLLHNSTAVQRGCPPRVRYRMWKLPPASSRQSPPWLCTWPGRTEAARTSPSPASIAKERQQTRVPAAAVFLSRM